MAEARRYVRPATVLAFVGTLIVVPGCGTFRPDPGTLTPGTYLQITPIHYRWSTRTYLLHIPRSYPAQKAWPFVLVLHGAFGTAGTMARQSGFSKLADQEAFVVAYPNRIGLFGYLQHWNAGHCCGLAEMDRVDDLGFLRYVIRGWFFMFWIIGSMYGPEPRSRGNCRRIIRCGCSKRPK